MWILPSGVLSRPSTRGSASLRVGAPQAEEAGELFVRVGRLAAELARVQIRLRRADADLRVAQAAQRRVDGGPARRDVGHVGDEHDVGSSALGLAAQQLGKPPGALTPFPPRST